MNPLVSCTCEGETWERNKNSKEEMMRMKNERLMNKNGGHLKAEKINVQKNRNNRMKNACQFLDQNHKQ